MTPPQMTSGQLAHLTENLQKRVDAKKLEIDALSKFRDLAPAVVTNYLLGRADFADAAAVEILQAATENYFTAKVNAALVDLEELELALKAYKGMGSGLIQVPQLSRNH